ncbi:hypothetical protein [Winogradskyella sp.]|uniref:hypothetical protein n=1 Tax=Winogradskyella sp. TaxID=1883156 RepID=UPI0026351487|nr:hypothetical protein [Winogradskyella sp.]
MDVNDIKNILKTDDYYFFSQDDKKISTFLKNNFYNHYNYEWSIKLCCDFIYKNNIQPKPFIEFLDEYYTWYYNFNSSKKGKKRTFKFIDNLKASKKFNSINSGKIKLKDKKLKADFLQDVKSINSKYFGASNEDLIKFLFNNFELSTTQSALNKAFYEKTV